MMPTDVNRVDVIIAAWNARATIGRAIQSALSQPEVSEVIVVDDASSDDTATVVRSAVAADPRVVLLASDGNKGPAAARNLALARSKSNFFAVLDADDFFLPSRFEQIFKVDGWDAIADNIAFVPDTQANSFDHAQLEPFPPEIHQLSLGEFVAGNIAQPGKKRAELGFLKPVIRRSFIDEHHISYDESLRLGEDFAFYGHMLGAGARFLTLKSCGYVAIERATSLSGSHRTQDLAALLAFARKFESEAAHIHDARQAILLHRAQLEAKLFHREILDVRQAKGRLAALAQAIAHPSALPALASGVLRDKLYQAPAPDREVRYLLG